MEYFVYMLRMPDGKLYVGCTKNMEVRFFDHLRGGGARTTRIEGTGIIIYTEKYSEKHVAFRRERQLKGWSHAKKIALAGGNLGELKRLARRKMSNLKI